MKKIILFFLAALLIIPISAIAQDRPVERRDLQRPQQRQQQRPQQRQQQRPQQRRTQHIQLDGICFEINTSNKTASVTRKDGDYTGTVTIPGIIIYKGTEYAVTSIGDYAFDYCTGLTSINIPNSVISIGENAFYHCENLTSITIPYRVTVIENGAFTYCSRLTSVTIPNSVTSIGRGSFFRTGLKSLTIPNSVSSIGAAAFQCCTGLKSITIPNSVTSIGDGAFWSCYGLTRITVNAVNPPLLDIYQGRYSTFDETNNCPIYVPAQSVAAYKAADGWREYADRIKPIGN